MLAFKTNVVNLYVDRNSHQWVVLDRDGNFWVVSTDGEDPWKERQPFYPTEDTDLERVPGHYKAIFRIPA